MGRAPCCDKANVKRGPWSPEEDSKLKAYIEQHGTGGNWIALPQKIGLKRCGKSCRLRWLNYLRPDIKHGGFSEEEDNIICSLYISIGSRWSIIAAQLPGRTDNDIKNYWNTRLKKKLLGRRKDLSQARRLSGEIQDHTKDENGIDDNPYSQGLSNSAFERLQLHMQLQSLHNPLSFFDNPALWRSLHPLGDRALLQLQHGLNNDSSPTTQMQQIVPHTQTVIPSQKAVLHEFSSSATSVNIEGGDNSITTNNRKQQDEMENSMINEGFSSLESSTIASIAFNNRSEAAAMGVTIMSSSQPNGMRMEQSSMSNIQSLSGLQTELNELIYGQNGGGFATIEDQMTTEFDCFKEMGDTSKDSMTSWWANDFDTKSSSSNSWDSTSVLHSEGMFQDYILGYDL